METNKLIGLGALGLGAIFVLPKILGKEEAIDETSFIGDTGGVSRGAVSGGESSANKTSLSGEQPINITNNYNYYPEQTQTKKEASTISAPSDQSKGVVYNSSGQGFSTQNPSAYGVAYDSLGQGMSVKPSAAQTLNTAISNASSSTTKKESSTSKIINTGLGNKIIGGFSSLFRR